MSLLERKKKQWEEERAFLSGAGINLWSSNGAGRGGVVKEGGSGTRRPAPPTDKPPDDTLKLHQEQQRLRLQLQQQEQQHKELEALEKQKQMLKQQQLEHQSLRIESQQINLQQQQRPTQMANTGYSSPPSAGITLPEEYNRRYSLQQPYQEQASQQRQTQPVAPQQQIKQPQLPERSLYNPLQPLDYQPPSYGYNSGAANSYHQPHYDEGYGHQQQNQPQQYPQQQYQQQYQQQQLYQQYQQYQAPQQQYQQATGYPSYYPPESGSQSQLSTAGYKVPTTSGQADVLTVRGTPPSGAFRWPASPESARTSRNSVASRRAIDTGSSRARWGDHGVGVGHLWDPTESNPLERRDSLPPSWVEQHAENALPGAPKSQAEEKTHARGGGMATLDPEAQAEKVRKLRKAEENQRAIERQLAEKKRLKDAEEEREQREAELWDERVKQQQEREAKEYQDEINKRRLKEEAEERRQLQLQAALRKAEERARQDKEDKKSRILGYTQMARNPLDEDDEGVPPAVELKNTKSPALGGRRPNSVLEETDSSLGATPGKRGRQNGNPPGGVQNSPPPRQQHQTLTQKAKTSLPAPTSVGLEEEVERGQGPKQHLTPAPSAVPGSAPPSLGSSQVGVATPAADLVAARVKLLTALGLTPEYLLSTGLLDRPTLLSLLGVGYESNFPSVSSPPSTGLSSASSISGDLSYISNRLLTPRKYRESRECGTQYDIASSSGSRRSDDPPSGGARPRKGTSGSRRSSSKDDRPQWNRHRSDRPYRKQSEKDPLVTKRHRRKQFNRSMSASGGDTGTEESDAQSGADLPASRRRRKTWDQSIQESLSSDLSRSPSPTESPLKRSQSRSTPTIKTPLATHREHPRSRKSSHVLSRSLQSLQRSQNPQTDSPSSSPSRDSPMLKHRAQKLTAKKRLMKTAAKKQDDDKEKGETHDHDGANQNDKVDPIFEEKDENKQVEGSGAGDNPDALEQRSSSPPVPALLKAAEIFDIPEYPPGEGPPEAPYKPPYLDKTKRRIRKPMTRLKKLPPGQRDANKQSLNPDDGTPSTENQSPVIKKKSEGCSPSRKASGGSNPVSTVSPPMTGQRDSKIDLTLQYYGEVRSSSPPVPAVQRRLEEEDTEAFPEVPGADVPTDGPKSVLPELPPCVRPSSSQHKVSGDASINRPESASRISNDSFFSDSSSPRPSRSSSSDAMASSPKLPSPSAGGDARPPTPRRLTPMGGKAPLETVPSTKKSASLDDMLQQPLKDRHQMTPVDVSGSGISSSNSPKLQSPVKRRGPQLPSVSTTTVIPGSDSSPQTSRRADSRRGSLTSTAEEEPRTLSVSSSGYESGRRSSDEPPSRHAPLPPRPSATPTLDQTPAVPPEKWEMLHSLSSLRQNLWRRQQEMVEQPESDAYS